MKVRELVEMLTEVEPEVEIIFLNAAQDRQIELLELNYQFSMYGSKMKTLTFLMIPQAKDPEVKDPAEKEGQDAKSNRKNS